MKITDSATSILSAATVGASLLVVLAAVITEPVSLFSALTLAAFLGSLIAPRTTLAAALAALPLGGNRPATIHSSVTVLIAAALLIGLVVRRVRSARHRQCTEYEEISSHPLLLAGFIYCVVSLASLSSIPWPFLIDDIRNAFDRSSLYNAAFSLQTLISSNEHALFYSLLSPYLTLLSYFLGLSVWRLCKEDAGTSRLFTGALLVGLLISLLVGLLDYYGVISLLSFRPLDHVVNPGGQQFRLQSFFAHSGWYAEYITLTIPTCLVLLGLRLPFWLRTALILLCLALGEFVLVLTYQRGGWLSYPITLLAVWGAIYVVRLIEQHNVDIIAALRRSILKVLISLPITIAISLALVFAFQRGQSAHDALSPYLSRFKEIQRTGDRTSFLFAGLLIGSKHPILGGGSDSFAWQFEREFVSPSGSFYNRYDLPLHGSAHNVYAQTFSGKGAIGLLALLALPFLMITRARRLILDPQSPLSSKLTVLTGACFAFAFLVYGNVQEVFYVQSLQFLFFTVVALTAAEGTAVTSTGRRPSPFVSLIGAAIIFSSHLAWEYLYPGTTARWLTEPREYGCYPAESAPSGASYRWCGERSLTLYPAPSQGAPLVLKLEAGPIAQTITIQAGNSTAEVRLKAGEHRRVELLINPTEFNSSWIPTRLASNASFVPRLLWPSSADRRRLAFKQIY